MENNFEDTEHIDSLSSFRKYMMRCLKTLKKVVTINQMENILEKILVKVINGLGKTIHIGINGEEAIEKKYRIFN